MVPMALSPERAAPWRRRVLDHAVATAAEHKVVAVGPRRTLLSANGVDRHRVGVVLTGADWRIEQDERWSGMSVWSLALPQVLE